MDTTKQPGLEISQVILLKAHFEHRADVFSMPTNTRIENLPLQLEAAIAGKKGAPAAVVRVRAFTGDDSELLYRLDVEVAALIAAVPGEENYDPYDYVREVGPAAFYPFLREAVASLTLKGRFGALWLKPFNFLAADAEAAQVVEAETTENR